jgi:sugar phosphate isomerase/epimerase
MTTPIVPELLATCWTSAGDVVPRRNGETSPIAIADRIAAVAAAGFTGIGIAAADLIVARDTIGYPTLSRLIDDSGIRTIELEYLEDWWATGARRHESDRRRQILFDAAEALGARHIKVGIGAPDGPFDLRDFSHEFDHLASEALTHGTRIGFEPPALSVMPTIAPAAAMVRDVANPGGGLLVDIWHIFRSGMPYSELAKIVPREYLFAVEINDGKTDPVGDLYDDTFDNRLLPGDGDFGVTSFIQAIDQIGYQGPWGVEVMSTRMRSLTVASATQRSHDAAAATFRAARRPRPVPEGVPVIGRP